MKRLFAKFASLVVMASAVCLVACGENWDVGSGAGYGGGSGSQSFNKRFYYYYGEDCRYDSFGAYNCSEIYSLSSYMTVSLNVTYDGYATLCVDDDCDFYSPNEYDVGYDHGDRYYEFPGDDERMIVYADGSELVYIDTYIGEAYYYYHDYTFDYGY